MDEDLQRALRPLRDRIDALDAQILDLLSQRARAAQEVGEAKHAAQADGPVLRPEREAEVIRRLQQLNPGPFPNAAVASVWTEIISACRGLERGMTVAYLGPQGSFSEQAALGISDTRCRSCRARPSMKCSAPSRPARPTWAWCRWKIPPKAPSTAAWTCC